MQEGSGDHPLHRVEESQGLATAADKEGRVVLLQREIEEPLCSVLSARRG